jgi:Fe-S-cluster-containing hydrogenase component 2
VIVDNDLCVHCAACVGICPTNDIFLYGTSRIVFERSCSECGLCAVLCPVGAIAANPGAPLPPAMRPRHGSAGSSSHRRDAPPAQDR